MNLVNLESLADLLDLVSKACTEFEHETGLRANTLILGSSTYADLLHRGSSMFCFAANLDITTLWGMQIVRDISTSNGIRVAYAKTISIEKEGE